MNTSIDAGTVLAALADPTRRDVLAAVAARSGTATATDLAAELPVTRQAIAKHLGVLAHAGLVTSTRQGREAHYRVVAGSLRPMRAPCSPHSPTRPDATFSPWSPLVPERPLRRILRPSFP